MMIPPNFSQLEESEAKCAEAQKSQQTAALELENLHTELETLSRNKTLVRSWRRSRDRGGGRAAVQSYLLVFDSNNQLFY